METIVSVEEHEQGWKRVPVRYRSGREFAVILHAPRRAQARFVARGLAEGKDLVDLVAACRPEVGDGGQRTEDGGQKGEQLPEDWVDRLDGPSADLVETVALVLTFGVDFEKKMVDLATARAAVEVGVEMSTEKSVA
jgi:hypothetical protein